MLWHGIINESILIYCQDTYAVSHCIRPPQHPIKHKSIVPAIFLWISWCKLYRSFLWYFQKFQIFSQFSSREKSISPQIVEMRTSDTAAISCYLECCKGKFTGIYCSAVSFELIWAKGLSKPLWSDQYFSVVFFLVAFLMFLLSSTFHILDVFLRRTRQIQPTMTQNIYG